MEPTPASAGVVGPPGLGGPLTASQHQLWALDQCTGMPAVLNLSYALRIEGPLDTVALADAFESLVRAHEPLRTLYRAAGGAPAAYVADAAVALRALDLTPRPVSGPEAAAQLVHEDRMRGFDLANEAPLRASLLKLADQQHLLLLTLHHIAADGWSLFVVRQALSRDYAARTQGKALEPTAPPTDLFTQATHQQAWLGGAAAAAELEWWAGRLDSATAVPDPLARPHDSTGVGMHRQSTAIPDELTARLRDLGRSAGVSLFVVLLSTFQALMLRWSGTAEPIIGTLAANRPTATSAEILGAHYNALLLNTDLGGEPSLAECLLRTAAETVTALDRQQLPHAMLTAELGKRLGWDQHRVPSAMFLMDRYPLEGLTLQGCEVTGLHLDDGTGGVLGAPPTTVPAATTAGLSFFVREAGERLTLSIVYAKGVLEDAVVADLGRGYLELLAALCETPELPLEDVELPVGEGDLSAASKRAPGPLMLREVTHIAPVDALSPVGIWVTDR
ncbi:condensation domain-containing protein [Streptomyces sp. NPDC059970]|uniref:condensation domain-containing protein n=1 Tax=Streptomyces sp. NPDC059970 TaxID=3347019 RepID=UPI0036B877F4